MLKGYRTLIFAIALSFFGVLEYIDWVSLLPEEYKTIGLIIIPMVFAVLRTITTTPIGQKEEE